MDRLKAVFSDEWDNELDSLQRHSRENISITNKILCCLKSAGTPGSLAEQATGFTLQTIDSVWPFLSSSATGPHSFQELSLAFLVRWGWKTLSVVGGAVIQFFAWAWANWALEPAKFEHLNLSPSSLVRVHPHLVLQMSKAAGWALQV